MIRILPFLLVATVTVPIAAFIGSIIHALSMPDFSPTLLALMGISSGTYLGFKFPVNT